MKIRVRFRKSLPGLFTTCCLVLSFVLPGEVTSQEVDVVKFANKTPRDATTDLLTWPVEKRQESVRRLLVARSPRCLAVALTILERTLDLGHLDDLAEVEDQIANEGLRKRAGKVLDDLKLYRHIAVENLAIEIGSASPEPSVSSDASSPFRPLKIGVRVVDAAGKVASDGGVQAFSEDFGVLIPFGGFEKLDRDGACQLDLFPGKWTIFAKRTLDKGKGLYLCRPGLQLADETAITLRPDKTVTLSFASLAHGRELESVLVIDSAFAGFLRPADIGPTAGGTLTLSTTGSRPLNIIGIAKPGSDPGCLFVSRNVSPQVDNPIAVGGTDRPATLRFEPSPEKKSSTVELRFWVRCIHGSEVTFKDAEPPFEMLVSPGAVEMAYYRNTSGGPLLSFSRRDYKLASGEERAFTLGGPYQCSIFHQFYKRFGRQRPNMLAYYLFVQDANGHFLTQYRPENSRGAPPPIPVEIHHQGKKVFDSASSASQRTRQLVSEVEGLPPGLEIDDALEYRVRLPFDASDEVRTIRGHGQDCEKTAKHFHFKGPHEVAESAPHWLKAAEMTYQAMAKLLGHDSGKREKGEVQGIRINAMMPPGVGAFAGGGNTTFAVGAGLAMTRPERMMNVPFFHELLHTFAHGHKDYMAVTCRETGVQLFNGSPAARFVHQKNTSDQLVRCLLGESNPDHTRVLGPLLLRSFGYEVFLQYFSEGRSQRDRLWAADLTEPETDCAIFDSFTGNRARTLFAAAGAPLRLEMVDKGVALLRSGSDSDETANGAQGPNPKRPVGRAIRTLEIMLERGDKDAAVKQIDVVREKLQESPDYRYRADVYSRVGEILYKAKLTGPAYEMLKDCQRAAARVGPGFVARARGMCMKVLKGLPTRTLM